MAELWDILDENGSVTGRLHERGKTMEDGEHHLEVSVWIENDSGEFLISQRSPNKTFANIWESTGGNVLTREDSLTAALREVNEELGVTLLPQNGRMIWSRLPCGTAGCNGLVDIWHFRQNIDISAVTLEPNETGDAKWASRDEINRMIDEGTFQMWGLFEYVDELFNCILKQNEYQGE